ncbi:hypothetical protein [Paracoccus sp. (in: a-proteobacteria)]|uniref:hypothetical protein n=1 Tax=Paracoccus sp. TaxID=267 RepID=UPI0028AC07EB|nr:hypothetical protein [Paracoccus sp. (in: a-proteobacteria)]
MRTIVQVKYFSPATKTFSDYPPGQPVTQVLLKDAAGSVEIAGQRWCEVWAFIDIGSDHSHLDHWPAKEANIRESGIPVTTNGIHGGEQTGTYDIEILLGKQQRVIICAVKSRLTEVGQAFPFLPG